MAGLLPILALAAATTLLPGELASRVDEDRLIRSVRLLSGADPIDGEHLTSRHIEHPHCRLAGEWLEQEFDELPSLELRREVFDVAGADDVFNVIAELPARVEPAEGVLVLGAHYDSTASLDEGWDPSSSPAPGADDNASGVAAILEVARLLSEWEGGFAWDVRFVAFSAEEEGLLGSFHHVEQLSGPVDLALILDPVGFNPGDTDLLWFSYDTGSVAARDALEESAASLDSPLSVSGVDEQLIGGDSRSDHFPFWEAGLPALHLGTFPPPPAYHTGTDTIDVVDPEFLRNVTALVAGHAVELASPLPFEEGGEACACTLRPADHQSLWLVLGLGLAATRRRRPQS